MAAASGFGWRSSTHLSSSPARRFGWLQANFRRELEGILEELSQEEEASTRLQKQLDKTQERCVCRLSMCHHQRGARR